MVAAALAVLMAMAAPAAPPPVPPPPSVTATVPGERGLARWTPDEVRCGDGVAVAAEALRSPPGQIGWTGMPNIGPVKLRFDIDAGGRPFSIVRAEGRFVPGDDSVLAALAASRFPAKARSACSVSFSRHVDPFAAAPEADLVAYSVMPMGLRLPAAGWSRILPAGDCSRMPRPQPLLRAYPDFERLPGTPGVKDWSQVGYDTDAKGRPVNVRTLHTTGNKALDDAAKEAVRQSRFTGGARTGCAYPYWREAEVVPAPPMPEDAALDPAGTCPGKREWATAPVLRFPPAYNLRRIEGWAVVRYDVAPWGAVGNAQVIASQPTEDFGKQAVRVIQSAKATASQEGYSGCVDRIRFVIRAAEGDDDTGGDEITVN